MIVKANVLGRIEQSFVLFKLHFLNFFIPIFIYKFISFLVFWVIFLFYGLTTIWNLDMWKFDIFVFLNNPKVVILITLWMILVIIYLILYIPILLGLLKSIKQALNEEEVTTKNNILYWFLNINNSFKTYWYIFAYVALLPSIIFIIWWILFNVWYFLNWPESLKEIWWIFMVIWAVIFMVFAIYRWFKSSFSITSAINNQSFTKDDFLNSIDITNKNWWRIFWNFFLAWIIVSLTSWFISWVLAAISHSSIDYTAIKSIEDVKAVVWNFSIVSESISGFLSTIISTVWSVFIIIFTYLLYIRLKEESIIIPELIPIKSEVEL